MLTAYPLYYSACGFIHSYSSNCASELIEYIRNSEHVSILYSTGSIEADYRSMAGVFDFEETSEIRLPSPIHPILERGNDFVFQSSPAQEESSTTRRKLSFIEVTRALRQEIYNIYDLCSVVDDLPKISRDRLKSLKARLKTKAQQSFEESSDFDYRLEMIELVR